MMKKEIRKCMVILFLCQICAFEFVKPSVVVKVYLETFNTSGSQGRDYERNECCIGEDCICSFKFNICYGTNSCFFSNALAQDELTRTTTFPLSLSGNTANPLTFRSSSIKDKFTLNVTIYNLDNNLFNDLSTSFSFDSVGIKKLLAYGGKNKQYPNELLFTASLNCTSYFEPPDCIKKLCVDHDDNINGHYTCDKYGNIICREGWSGTSTKCLSALKCATAFLDLPDKLWKDDYFNNSSKEYNKLEVELLHQLQKDFIVANFTKELFLKVVEFKNRNSLVSALVKISYGVLEESQVENCKTLINLPLSFRVIYMKPCDCCVEETIGKENEGGVYNFPVTLIDSIAILPCKYNSSFVLQRRCLQGNSFALPEWEPAPFVPSTCPLKSKISQQLSSLENVNVTASNIVNVTKHLNNIIQSGNLTNEYDVQMVSNIMKNIIGSNIVNSSSENVTKGVLLSVDNLLSSNSSLIKSANKIYNTSTMFLSLLDDLAKQQTKNLTISLNSMGLATYASQSNKNSIYIRSMDHNDSIGVQISSDELVLKSSKEYIVLPSQLLSKQNNTLVYSYIYRENTFFNENSGVLDSVIFSATLNGVRVEDSSNPISIKFSRKSSLNGNRTCRFYKFEEQIWSSEGCNTTRNSSSEILCKCNHLTSFVVMLDVYQMGESQLTLSIVTWIGCILSIFGLSFTIVSYSAFAELRKKRTPKILVILCINLLFTLLLFLGLAEKTNPPGLCQAASSLLQFFLLSTFFWMAIEGLNLYFMFVKVLGVVYSTRSFILKSSVFAWGIPLVITIITATNKPDYSFAASSNKTTHLCVIQGNSFYFGILLPVCLVLGCNYLILVLVLKGISSSPALNNKIELKRKVRMAFAFSVLLGTNWLFAILAVGDASKVFQWLFCIFNSLQGFFIFIFYSAKNEDVRKQWKLFLWEKCDLRLEKFKPSKYKAIPRIQPLPSNRKERCISNVSYQTIQTDSF